jgi:hypothetical protein
MKQFWSVILIIGFFIGVLVSGCAQSKDKEPVEVKVDPVAEETARQIRKELRTPIDKAQKTQELGDERTEAIDQALKQK